MMKPRRSTIMLVDDHAVVREGYRRLIEKQDDMAVVAEAGDGTAAYRLYKAHRPDLVILDLSLPGKGGIEVIRHLRQWDSLAVFLVFSMHHNPAYVTQAFQAGAKGYVTKSSDPALLIDAIRDVLRGQRVISPDVSRELALLQLDRDRGPLELLSAREFEIFRMIVEARSTSEIAAILNLSAKTVANHHYRIKSKLGVASDIEMIHLAIRMKLIADG